jgi:hypothetical protein
MCVQTYCDGRAQCLAGEGCYGAFEVCEGLSGNDLDVCLRDQFNYYVFDMQMCFCNPNQHPGLSCRTYVSCN